MMEMVSVVDVHPGIVDSSLQFPEDWFYETVSWSRSDSGEPVNPNTALGHGPVWQAVNILSGDLGQLPVHKMRRRGEEVEKDRRHPIEWLITQHPNDYQTPSVWKETMMAWALLWGNGISGIVREAGRPVELVPFLPDRTTYEKQDGEYIIITRIDDRDVAVRPEDTIHIKGLASDGFWGLSAVKVAKNVIGHGLALQKHGNSVFKNGALPSSVLKHPGRYSKQASDNIRSEWHQLHGGSGNSGKVAVLWDKMELQQLSMSNEDAQWLEGRKLDREFIASLFNIPAFKLNALENSAVRANLEEQNRDYFNTSLSRWTNRFIEEFARKLLTPRERRSGDHFFRWFTESFLRGDTLRRFEAYAIGKQNKILTTNEIRSKEDMNPIEGGDILENPNVSKNEGTQEAVRDLIVSQVDALVAAESGRSARYQKSKSPQASMEKFYDGFLGFAEPFLSRPSNVALSSGFKGASWRHAASDYADRRRAGGDLEEDRAHLISTLLGDQ